MGAFVVSATVAAEKADAELAKSEAKMEFFGEVCDTAAARVEGGEGEVETGEGADEEGAIAPARAEAVAEEEEEEEANK